MLTILGNDSGKFCDGLSRRSFLQIGGLALGGASLPQILAAEAAAVGIHPQIRFTCAFSDGETLYAIRYATDGQAPSLFAHHSAEGGSRLVSEPLDDDGDAWQPIAPCSFVVASDQGLSVRRFDPLASDIAQAV